jgi:hypothetical protein
MFQLITLAKAAFRCEDYRPQGVSLARARQWLQQFPKADRRAICKILNHIVYFSERQTTKILIEQNDALLKKLKAAGLSHRNIIYVQIHDAGSSSPVMVNLVRDGGRLETLGCRFIDSRNSMGVNHLTNRLTEGAIVYVDDFLGTGNQFCEAREFMMESVIGNFSEFLLVPCICEEAYSRLSKIGVEVFTGHIHTRAERPLHDNSAVLTPEAKHTLRELCVKIQKQNALGYEGLASMVVLYRNAPDTLPKIFRGNVDQSPYTGIFPRISDLPRRVIP